MVNKIIQLNEGKEARQLIADEGKLLFFAYELDELGNEAQGVSNVIIPMCWDYEQIYVESQENNITEK